MSKRHGMSKTPEHMIWCSMIQRCENPRCKTFKHYGGRGIKVCDRWRRSFTAFFTDVGPRPEPSFSLDRINNNGNYEPGNVRWTTRAVQRRNSRRVRIIKAFGKRMCLKDWATHVGIHEGTIRSRLKTGMTFEEAIAHRDLRVTRPAVMYGKEFRQRLEATG